MQDRRTDDRISTATGWPICNGMIKMKWINTSTIISYLLVLRKDLKLRQDIEKLERTHRRTYKLIRRLGKLTYRRQIDQMWFINLNIIHVWEKDKEISNRDVQYCDRKRSYVGRTTQVV